MPLRCPDHVARTVIAPRSAASRSLLSSRVIGAGGCGASTSSVADVRDMSDRETRRVARIVLNVLGQYRQAIPRGRTGRRDGRGRDRAAPRHQPPRLPCRKPRPGAGFRSVRTDERTVQAPPDGSRPRAQCSRAVRGHETVVHGKLDLADRHEIGTLIGYRFDRRTAFIYAADRAVRDRHHRVIGVAGEKRSHRAAEIAARHEHGLPGPYPRDRITAERSVRSP